MTALQKGDIAPEFNFTDLEGNTVSLSDLKGSKVVLYFYPKDDTPGCTAEACNLRDNYQTFLAKGYKIIGVSPDKLESHLKFRSKYDLPFPLIPDPDKLVINAYGVWGPKKFMGRSYEGVLRTTFIIDEKGIIESVITQVDTKNHTEQILI